jgi:hypothetical protein
MKYIKLFENWDKNKIFKQRYFLLTDNYDKSLTDITKFKLESNKNILVINLEDYGNVTQLVKPIDFDIDFILFINYDNSLPEIKKFIVDKYSPEFINSDDIDDIIEYLNPSRKF